MTNQYTQAGDGTVVIHGPASVSLVPKLLPSSKNELVALVLKPWAPIIEEESKRTGVPEAALAAAIYQESRGNPALVGTDPGGGHGYGLTMLTAHDLFQGHTPDEVTARAGDPPEVVQAKAHLNLALGADFLRTVYHVLGDDFPKVVSGYNAGFDYKNRQPWPMASSSWGYRETINKSGVSTIDQYVKAFNSAIELGLTGNREPGTGQPYVPAPPGVITASAAGVSDVNPMLLATAGAGAMVGAALVRDNRIKGAGVGLGIGVGAYLLGRLLLG